MNFLPVELSLEQQFHLRLVEQSLQNISHEQALELLFQAAELLMIKDNLIKELLREVLQSDFSRGKENIFSVNTG
jgi:hypothetical protein